MRRGEQTPDDLERPDGNGLQDNYELHDIGHQEIVDRINAMVDGVSVEDWGIDMRDDGGDDGVIYDDKTDFKVTYHGHLIALVEVKTKSSPRYMGRFNERHYAHYYAQAQEHDVPVFVVMFQVDENAATIQDEFVFEIGREEMYDPVYSSTDSTAVSSFPDGNDAVLVPHDEREDWRYLHRRLLESQLEIQHEVENS